MYQTTYKVCNVHQELEENLNTKIGCILVGWYVNDIENKIGAAVAEDLIRIVNRVKNEHPGTTVVLGEVTPCHQHEKEVAVCKK